MGSVFIIKQWAKVLSILVTIAFITSVVYNQIRPNIYGKLDLDLSIRSIDTYFDPNEKNFERPIRSNSKFHIDLVEQVNSTYQYDIDFQVVSTSNEIIFKNIKSVWVDKNTGFLDKESAYMLCPKQNIEEFDFYHSSGRNTFSMRLSGKDTLFGFVTNVYKGEYVGDLAIDDYNKARDNINNELQQKIWLTIWVDPDTGLLIKYIDYAELYERSRSTTDYIRPFLKYQNECTDMSTINRIDQVNQLSKLELLYSTSIPSFLLILLVIILITGSSYVDESKKTSTIIAFIILISGLGVSYLTYHQSKIQSDHSSKYDFLNYSTNMKYQLRNQVDLNTFILQSLATHFEVSGLISREKFRKVANELLESQDEVLALGWVQKVLDKDRYEFERSIRAQGFKDYYFKHFEDGIETPTYKRDVYYPVVYVEPLRENRKALGLAPGNTQVSRERALENATENGSFGTTDHFYLVQNENKVKSFIVYYPVFRNGEVFGFVYGIYKVDVLINDALKSFFNSYGVNLEVSEIDINGNKITLGEFGDPKIESDLNYKSNVMIGDKKWDISFSPTDTFFNKRINYFPIILFTSGIFLTIIISVFIFWLLNDNSKELEKINQELKLKSNILEEKNNELENFAHGIAHDLKNPLMSILGYTQLVKELYANQTLDKDGIDLLESSENAVRRMSSMIADILSYAKLGSNRKFDKVDLNEILQYIKEDLSSLSKENKATINVDKLPVITASRSEMISLFQNLISNAIKFKQKNIDPMINISSYKDGSYYIISIEDNGIGIPSTNIQNIFKIFYRDSSAKDYAGTGIGLANCKKIVDIHNGKIEVESEIGEGTIFKVILPIEQKT